MSPKQQRTRTRFKVITPFRSLVLCGKSKQEMEDWLNVLRTVTKNHTQTDSRIAEMLSGNHQWYATSHARPTYCNICRDALYGVTSHGLSCEICKYKVHKRCSIKAINNCKWTTLASIGKDIIEDQDGNITMPHQWMEGNLPVSSKCSVCDKTCGSVLRLQDWRCLWCRATVHTACRPAISVKCPLGPVKLSVVPPTALHSIGNDEAWEATRPTGCSPLLVFVNSKSGDNQGVKFLRRFKQLLNPAQVFDLIKGGPGPGLRLFRHFDPFRILVCSGDGSVGWVLSEIDRLGMHKQCQVGVLPLGTGNDLARVLGWGSSCDDDAHLPQLLEKYEKAGTKMLDRWSIMTFERSISLPCPKSVLSHSNTTLKSSIIHQYEDNVVTHITNILESDEENVVLSNIRILCGTVKDFATYILENVNSEDQQVEEKCKILQQKLNSFLEILCKEEGYLTEHLDDPDNITLNTEISVSPDNCEKGVLEKPEKDITNLKKVAKKRQLIEKETVISRANSLKRIVRKLVEYSHLVIDDQININTKHATKIGNTNSSLEDDTVLNLISNKRQQLDIPGLRVDHVDNLSVGPLIESVRSADNSTCTSPVPNLASLSPIPDLRRDSQPEELLTLPAPDGFADSRRNSENLPQDSFNFQLPTAQSVSLDNEQEAEIPESNDQQISDSNNIDISSEFQITVTRTTFDTSSPSEDGTTQDISSDIDSIQSPEEHEQKLEYKTKMEVTKGYIDSDAFDSEIRHIDSPDNSEMVTSEIQNSESLVGQDLTSIINGEEYDSVREYLENELENTDFTNEIARRSFKKSTKSSTVIEIENKIKYKVGSTEQNVNEANKFKDSQDAKASDLLSPVCCFTVSSETTPTNEKPNNFPATISVIINPPSPSMSIESQHDSDVEYKMNPYLRRHIGESMERLSVELPESGFSPQATRRISSGSLLKASEVVSLAATAARFGGSNASLRHEKVKSVEKTEDVKKLPIINPLVRLPMWPNVSGGTGLISQALLANADALCAAVSPLMDPDETLMEGYFERCVMNNYFGIGIDAKISLDFHHKREEHPEKCRSRAKNYMWYGVLGSKQWLQKTYKNLEQRVQLECDGQRIPLPSLQGIVVLNIPSFMGGTNFWGGTKEGDLFLAPSFDDRILEVVAVFGSVQMAASRLINLQHHRIAQCQTVQINILGDEGVPIQVDGEAWIQPPGIIRIIHKNRMQMLYRNRALETSLKTWEEKQRNTLNAISQSASTLSNTQLQSQPKFLQSHKPSYLNDDEMYILLGFIEVVTTLVKWVKLLIISHPSLEPDLYQVAARTAQALEQVHPDGKILQGINLRPVVTELVSSARQLYEDSCELLRDKAQSLKLREDLENKLSFSLASMEQEVEKFTFEEGARELVHLQNLPSDEQGDRKNCHGCFSWLKVRRSGANSGAHTIRDQVTTWSVEEVCSWLKNLQLTEYNDHFVSHDIRGRELLSLTGEDLEKIGITKVGHVKRILQAINDLNN
ncbi:diacylglycerol kinase eta isoform X14 [Bombus affinis]|uniref:diacylglycerol kinase eta isoform X6 n=1 Tax=Bombus affinis TaxID=309941 RepID=UPI0021B84137|nr:diacylglycerol kinase eta isoform X6 [Bombus affinis]XP_050594872.1 diacylglycerol kinase eta isoform X7 [Bombus affinis]XP_050594883.1 diacylglycerol kinase eta isoform X8 [Bombus affinis]XP_050594893.1 diacylglycerol kinase eta isoform X9 [Bombus affinis]XP_050594903.1 diacylglycerol kinase eta isoform X10 [Bombus affinis]XP_050594912.1 diacylglycerol kinase eta isoform X11 [Bombus affinis]XP_050594923.1 diacylglycerol kinase eta isoform X12 [Bombus affinis]XP_050594933.1 diacylglycerol